MPGHNPHAHILLTVRSLDELRKRQYKTEKEYLCVKSGEERGFTASKFKQAQGDEQVSKYPKSSKFGRQNPITDINNTESIDTDSFFSSDWNGWETDELKDRADYEQYFREQFNMEFLLQQYPYEEDVVNEMLNLVVDTVCSKRKTIRITSDDKPLEVVKSVFMKLEQEHISMVLRNMKENTTRIRNMKQYLLAALYNAPLTINNYYSSLVQHHMATGQI